MERRTNDDAKRKRAICRRDGRKRRKTEEDGKEQKTGPDKSHGTFIIIMVYGVLVGLESHRYVALAGPFWSNDKWAIYAIDPIWQLYIREVLCGTLYYTLIPSSNLPTTIGYCLEVLCTPGGNGVLDGAR